jgi:hypothetical protein
MEAGSARLADGDVSAVVRLRPCQIVECHVAGVVLRQT